MFYVHILKNTVTNRSYVGSMYDLQAPAGTS